MLQTKTNMALEWCVLGDFEDAEETDATQDGHSKWRHDVRFGQNHFDDTTNDDETVESIEERHEITLRS